MYKLNDIWLQAYNDSYAIPLNGNGYESRVVYGIKIVRDNATGHIQILNTMSGEYYHKLSSDELDIFYQHGWRYGIYSLNLTNYLQKLESIKECIKAEVNGLNRLRKVKVLKSNRDLMLNK
jgi:hypothetical protein